MAILPLFTQHSRSWRENRYVYPVLSRRARGLSIGVNLNPDKVCNFDCVYCCVDRTTPAIIKEVDLEILRDELDHLLGLAASGEIFSQPPFDQTPAPLRRLNDVAFSGDGEPTSYKKFGPAGRMAVELLEKHQLSNADARVRPPVATAPVKIVIITNATLFHRPVVREALAYLDSHHGEIWAKLDAGTQVYYKLIERTSIPLSRVIENILDAGRVRPVVIQSLFLQLHDAGPDDAEIDAYIARLKELVSGGGRIKLVQVYTVARSTAVPECTPLQAGRLDAISARVKRETGLEVETYYGPG